MGEIEVKKIGRQRWVISNGTWVKYFGPQNIKQLRKNMM